METETMNILLTIPSELNVKLCADAAKEHRSRQAHIVYLLEKNFKETETPNGRGKKEKAK
jgi:hypothetical protein